jgi:hypothetical protein
MRSPRDAEATPMRRGAAGRPASNRRPWPIGLIAVILAGATVVMFV